MIRIFNKIVNVFLGNFVCSKIFVGLLIIGSLAGFFG